LIFVLQHLKQFVCLFKFKIDISISLNLNNELIAFSLNSKSAKCKAVEPLIDDFKLKNSNKALAFFQ